MKKRSKLGWVGLAIATLLLLATLNYLDVKFFDKLNPFSKSETPKSEAVTNIDLERPVSEVAKDLAGGADLAEPISPEVQARIERYKAIAGAGENQELVNEPETSTEERIARMQAAMVGAESALANVEASFAEVEGLQAEYTEGLEQVEANAAEAMDAISELNQAKAAKLKAGADAGDLEDQYWLAMYYTIKDDDSYDPSSAVLYFLDAAQKGHEPAIGGLLYSLKALDLSDGEQKEILNWLKYSADQGRADSQFALSRIHKGDITADIERDDKLWAKWAKKSAQNGYAKGEMEYGRGLKNGVLIKKDLKESITWLTKAAEQGNVFAQNELGHSYYMGIGVPEDTAQGILWFKKAALAGDKTAQASLANIGISWE